MNLMHDHFAAVASSYASLRTTDDEPIRLIHSKLDGKPSIKAADVGCGVGRYVKKLFDVFGNRLFLYCIDENEFMLANLVRNVNGRGDKSLKAIKAEASELPLASDSLDFILTFNAIHHFDLQKFLKESARVLKDKGRLFIYTRLRSQNRKNIWGMYFPGFNEKETRLYEIDEVLNAVEKTERMRVESIEFFRFKRESSLERLIKQAKGHHYSTFSLYSPREFDLALSEFISNIKQHYENTSRVKWADENIMFILRKC